MRATIGITTGDPAGIGLEIVLKSIAAVLASARWVLFTDRAVFERNAALFACGLNCRWIADPSGITDESALFLHDARGDTSLIDFGKGNPQSGQRALAYLKAASEAALKGHLQAIV